MQGGFRMIITIGILMAIAGHLIHLIKKVVEIRATGERIGIIEYVMGRPYRTALGMAGSAAAMGYMIEAGNVTAMGALAVGYMADSGLGMLRGRS
jgi:2-keto-4-pentenoate hydratase